MTKFRLALMLFIVLAGSSCSNRGGVREEFAPDETLALAWTIQTDGAINHPPLIVGDIVILALSGSPLLALDLETGAAKWTFAPPEGVWERAYASDGKRVFVGVKNGSLAALDVSNGKLLRQLREKRCAREIPIYRAKQREEDIRQRGDSQRDQPEFAVVAEFPKAQIRVLEFVFMEEGARDERGKRAAISANFSEEPQTISRRMIEQYAIQTKQRLHGRSSVPQKIESLDFVVLG